MKRLISLALALPMGAHAAEFTILSVLLRDAASNQIINVINGHAPGNMISAQTLNPQTVLSIKAQSSGVNVTCAFDGAQATLALPNSQGFYCPVPNNALVNGAHLVVVQALDASAPPNVLFQTNDYYQLDKSPIKFLAPTISCLDANCVQTALNAAMSGQLLDFGNSNLTDCGTISLDQVRPNVTIKNLTLNGKNTLCNIGNTTTKAQTVNVTLDSLTINNGTIASDLKGCQSGLSAASVMLFGSQNTLQNSKINGGTASGVLLGGSYNTVKDTYFNGVNTVNANSMTDCAGVLVTGTYDSVLFSSFDGSNGASVHLSPQPVWGVSATGVVYGLATTGNNLVYGNLMKNSCLKSFENTPYPGDGGGGVYTGWSIGSNVPGGATLIAYNIVQGVNPNLWGLRNCGGFPCAAGLYTDNNTSLYTVTNNFVSTGSKGIPALRINPQTWISNPGGKLKSEKRVFQGNTLIGDQSAIAIQAKVLDGSGKTVIAVSADGTCPSTCNNAVQVNGAPSFSAGVGAGATLPPPDFLPVQ